MHEATKPGISRLVTITAAVGFAMGAWSSPPPRVWSDVVFAAIACIIGTYLSAGGANALNQYVERARDAKMNRTMRRPLPQDRLTPSLVLWFGVACSVLGVAILWGGAGWAPAAFAASCTLTYLLIYTPMKPKTTFSTYVGTIPGALPPMIGWAAGMSAVGAVGGQLPSLFGRDWWGGWSLFVLMTVWQLPHSFALAWMYKDDYAKGGYRLLPVVDPTGVKTSVTIAVWALAQMPATLLPVWAMPGLLGWPYATIAVLTGLWYFYLAARLLRTRAVADARKVFFVSIMHLPLLLVAMVVEAGLRGLL